MDHHTTDSQMVRAVSIVLGLMVLLFFAIVTTANLIVDPSNTAPNKVKLAAMAARTAPVGKVRTSATAGVVAVADTPAQAADTPKTGRQIVEGACLACHAAAVAAALGAPPFGDAAIWAGRLSAGIEALVNNAINGIGAMPPRGGSSLSDAEIRLAVEYLSGQ